MLRAHATMPGAVAPGDAIPQPSLAFEITEMPFLTYRPNRVAQPGAAHGEAPRVIALPRPDSSSGVPLMTTLSIRACMREFAPAPVRAETSGALLRGADGINRPVTSRRTAPSSHALQAIHIDAALPDGVDRHDASPHRLTLGHATNARNLTGYQDFVGTARLGLRYVVRTSLFLDMAASRRNMISAVTARAISQNVSLHRTSAGLAAVARGRIDHHLPSDMLSLKGDGLPILARTAGLSASDAKQQPGA